MNEQWIIEGPDESVGIFGWAIYHEATADCETIPDSVTMDSEVAHAVCTCGSVYHEEREL